MEELKPCPFCGSKDVSVEIVRPYFMKEYYQSKLAAAGCHQCGASTQLFSAAYSGNLEMRMTKRAKESAKERAIIAWNRRADDG